jgi:hypothetical protein
VGAPSGRHVCRKCRCAGSRISCGCSKRSTWLGNRQDGEDQPREVRRNPGILGFPAELWQRIGLLREPACVSSSYEKTSGSWVSRGGPRRRFAMGVRSSSSTASPTTATASTSRPTPAGRRPSRTRVSHWRHAQAPPAPLTVSPSSARKAAARIPSPPSTQYVRGEHLRPGPAGHTRAMKT